MIGKLFRSVVDINQREIDRYQKLVVKINELETSIVKLKDRDFAKKTSEFKERFKKGEKLESILPEAFALVREATNRTLGMRHYDEQLLASIALFEGNVAEQKTGEGKTLSAVPALYLRALSGNGSHLVTVNDYLARRDAGWNGPVFAMLGMTVGAIVQELKSYVYDPKFIDNSHGDERLSHLKPSTRREAYATDITYGTNNEFGFDYLRDNMVSSLEEMSQRGHYFAIVDEVDSILIDEARTPLIISAPDSEPTDKYFSFAKLIDKLDSETDFTIDEKFKSASLTERGIEKIEKLLGVDNLYEKDFEAIHHVENALRARGLYIRDRDYVVKDGQVIIVDEFTGRLMFGRRWSDGLHQSVEAKEGVTIQQESKTLATISFQNYFRMYEHLSGMTGTAATEASEFKKIYNLEVLVIPTHRSIQRKDEQDSVYKTLQAKYGAIAEDILRRNKEGQPVLVGTTSIEKNEIISEYLKRKKIPHNVLNAKNHESEAKVLADAGKPGAVTVATNMAGRGVDIVLGGSMPERDPLMSRSDYEKSKDYKKWIDNHERVKNAGGLHVLGTERHESRRIDNQLRGRAGRQGDPGSSQFFLCLEDDLMRIFGGDRLKSVMDRLQLPDDQPIENPLISRAIEGAQIKVEGFHFDSRKSVVDYDDVNNNQRDIIYKLRKRVLSSENLGEEVVGKLKNHVERILLSSIPEDLYSKGLEKNKKKEDWKLNSEISQKIAISFADIIPLPEHSIKELAQRIQKFESVDSTKEFLVETIDEAVTIREKQLGSKIMRLVEKEAYLGSIDKLWIEHLDTLEDLREGIRLRAYGQRDPLVEYKNEAFGLFEGLIDRIDEEVGHRLLRLAPVRQVHSEIPLDIARTNVDSSDNTGLVSESPMQVAESGEMLIPKGKSKSDSKKETLGRNDPCWCGSGKKWKKCHYPQLQ